MRFLIPYFLQLLLMVGGVVTLYADTWEEANASFAAGEYGKALPLYQDLIDREGPTASRLFNLGNTHAKLNQPGPAVLCYERAALLAPRDADIQANLKLVLPVSTSNIEAGPPWWKTPLYWLSLHEWSWLLVLGLTLLTVPILIGTLLAPRPVWLLRTTGPFIGSGLALALLSGLALQQRVLERSLAILTANQPILRLSPFTSADPVDAGPPLPGQRVIPGERHGGWVYLGIPGSTAAGWVPEQDIALIIPPT